MAKKKDLKKKQRDIQRRRLKAKARRGKRTTKKANVVTPIQLTESDSSVVESIEIENQSNDEKIEIENRSDNEKTIPVEKECISNTLLDYAAPFLEGCEAFNDKKRELMIAIVTWNLSLLPKDDRDSIIQKLIKDLNLDKNSMNKGDLMAQIDELLKRKQQDFLDDRRVIVKYEIEIEKEGGEGETFKLELETAELP